MERHSRRRLKSNVSSWHLFLSGSKSVIIFFRIPNASCECRVSGQTVRISFLSLSKIPSTKCCHDIWVGRVFSFMTTVLNYESCPCCVSIDRVWSLAGFSTRGGSSDLAWWSTKPMCSALTASTMICDESKDCNANKLTPTVCAWYMKVASPL